MMPAPLIACVIWPAKSRPAAQLAPWSYLGVAFKRAGAFQRERPQHPRVSTVSAKSGDSSDLGHTDPSPDSDESETPSDSSPSDDQHHRQHH